MNDLSLNAETRRLLCSYRLSAGSFETVRQGIREALPVHLPELRGSRPRFSAFALLLVDVFRETGRDGVCALWEKGGRVSFCVYDRMFWRGDELPASGRGDWFSDLETKGREPGFEAFDLEVRLGEAGGARVAVWADLETSFAEDFRLPCETLEADEDFAWALEGMAWRCAPFGPAAAATALASRGLDVAGSMAAALDNIPCGIALFGNDAKPYYLNGMAETLLSTEGGRMRIDCEELISQVLLTGEAIAPKGQQDNFQIKIRKEDRFFRPFIIPLYTQNGERSGVLMSLIDTTGLQLVSDLESDFLGSVSHELKGPLTSIRMAVLLLHDSTLGDLNPQQRELVDTAKEEVERLIRTLAALLDVQRAKQGERKLDRELVPANDILQAAAAEMRRSAEDRQLRIRIENTDSDESSVLADRDRLVHVMNLFISNAIKHSAPGSEICISVNSSGDGKLRFAVKDSGPGIPLKLQQQIFNRYVRGPGEEQSGDGLGLSMARELVQAHEGRIGVESAAGQGSVFFFEIEQG